MAGWIDVVIITTVEQSGHCLLAHMREDWRRQCHIVNYIVNDAVVRFMPNVFVTFYDF